MRIKLKIPIFVSKYVKELLEIKAWGLSCFTAADPDEKPLHFSL
jgi:hypothetical protein